MPAALRVSNPEFIRWERSGMLQQRRITQPKAHEVGALGGAAAQAGLHMGWWVQRDRMLSASAAAGSRGGG